MENEKKREITLEELECVTGGTEGSNWKPPVVGNYVRVKYSNNSMRSGKVVSIGTRSSSSGESKTIYYVEFLDGRQPKVDTVYLYQILG